MTEGWIAGMKIASLSAELQHDPEHLLRNMHGGTRSIARYLKEVVPTRCRKRCLISPVKTSFLSRLNAELCNAVTGRDDSQAMLAWIERRNLFCQPLTNKATGSATILCCRKIFGPCCSRTTILIANSYMN